ncbi:MAG: hypothetical protein DCF29_19285 [Alphaproteobacteria bacterium]|nr:MAG: hypothetical protein DCF29_19285 [Alphaproteobacteria bacterium]
MSRPALFAALCTLSLVACDAQSDAPRSIDAYAAAKQADTVETGGTASVLPEEMPTAAPANQAVRGRASQSQADSTFQAFNAIWGRPAPVRVDTASGSQTIRSGEVSYLGGGRAVLVAYGDAASTGGKGGIVLRSLIEGPEGLKTGPGQLLWIENSLGSSGRSDWTIRHDLMSDPVMIIEDNGPWGDYSCVGANLVALTAAGPVLLQPGDRRVRPLPNPDNLPLC